MNRTFHWALKIREKLSLAKNVDKEMGEFKYQAPLIKGNFAKASESATWRGKEFARIPRDHLNAVSLILVEGDELDRVFQQDYLTAGVPYNRNELQQSFNECMAAMR